MRWIKFLVWIDLIEKHFTILSKDKTKVFVGVAGIYNYKKFWSNLKSQNYYLISF